MNELLKFFSLFMVHAYIKRANTESPVRDASDRRKRTKSGGQGDETRSGGSQAEPSPMRVVGEGASSIAAGVTSPLEVTLWDDTGGTSDLSAV